MTRRKQKWLIRVAFEVQVEPLTVTQAWDFLRSMEQDLRDEFGAVEVKAHMAALSTADSTPVETP